VLGALNFVLHRRTFLNQSNRRSTVQWYFPLKCSLVKHIDHGVLEWNLHAVDYFTNFSKWLFSKPFRTPEPKVTKPVTAPVAVEEKKPEPAKPVNETETPTNDEPKQQKTIKEMTDAERAAIRAAKFGGTAVAETEDKKLARAQRFGLPVTASSNGKASKIGAAPVADLETLKKRAERFGQTTSNVVKKMEEDEKIKKRQERFGEVKNGNSAKKMKIEVNKSLVEKKVDPDLAEKLKKRAERFGAASS